MRVLRAGGTSDDMGRDEGRIGRLIDLARGLTPQSLKSGAVWIKTYDNCRRKRSNPGVDILIEVVSQDSFPCRPL